MSKDLSRKPECILYVCCGSKCKKRGSKQLYKQLKNSVKENSLKKQIQVIKTGCTDRCKMGPVVALMPDNEWHFQVEEERAMSLFKQVAHRLRGLD
jgi:NADH:ubiquinone oxidoreductase subunit E